MYAFKFAFGFIVWVTMLMFPLVAQPFNDRPPRRPIMERPTLELQSLNLSDEQKKKIQGIQQEDRRRIQELRKQTDEAQEEARVRFLSESDEQVLRRFDRIQEVQAQVARIRIENLLKIRQVLTPQQRQQLREQLTGRRLPRSF